MEMCQPKHASEKIMSSILLFDLLLTIAIQYAFCSSNQLDVKDCKSKLVPIAQQVIPNLSNGTKTVTSLR